MKDFSKLQEIAKSRGENAEMWQEAADALEAIALNKQFLEVAESKKREHAANIVSIAEQSKILVGIVADIKVKDGERQKMEYGVATYIENRKKRLIKEQDIEMAKKRGGLVDKLSGLEDDITLKKVSFDNASNALGEVQFELRRIQVRIAEAL